MEVRMRRMAVVLAGVLLLGALGGSAWLWSTGALASPEVVVCTKLVECGIEADTLDTCTEDIGVWMERHPRETADLASCVADASSCSGVSGCMVGAGLRTLGGDVSDFFKGIGRTIGIRK